MSSNPNYPFTLTSLRHGKLANALDSQIQYANNDYYNFNDNEIKLIMLNPLFSASGDTGHNQEYVGHGGFLYKNNTDGFRSDDFKNNEEIVIAGCSHTYGYGVPEEMIWGVRVAKYFNLSYANLGIPGASVSTIVNNLFAYFKKYGHPKTLICVFPNFQRLMLPVDINVLIADNTKRHVNYKNLKMSNITLNNRILDHSYYEDENNRPKYSQVPHLASEVIPEIVPYWMAVQSIHMLEQYCDVANIKLVWSIWDWQTLDTFKLIKDKYPGYFNHMIDIKMDHWIASVQKNIKDASPIPFDEIRKDRYHKSKIDKYDICVEDQDLYCEHVVECHKDVEKDNPNIFNIAGDFAHWGTHRHVHIAEIFIKELEEYYAHTRN